MRIAGGLAAGAVVAGLIVAGGAAAPAARAAAGTPAAPEKAAAPAGVQARWAELANAATGANLWSRSSTLERPMGSITKVMTAYVVLTTPGVNLNRVITVPSGIVAYDEKYDASTAGLRPGEKYTAMQLLYAMMLPSGCDAAYTLASAYGPGLQAFIAKMNAAARALGMTKTHFTDFSGLPDPGDVLDLLHGARPDRAGPGRDAEQDVRVGRGGALVPASRRKRPRGARLGQPGPAAGDGTRRDRHQDRVHGRRRAVPAL